VESTRRKVLTWLQTFLHKLVCSTLVTRSQTLMMIGTDCIFWDNYVSPSNEGRHIVLVWFFSSASSTSSQRSLSRPDTPPYSHAPTYQLSFTYLERQKCYGPDKKILFKKQLFDLKVKVPRRSLRYATHRLMSYTHIPNIIYLSGKTKRLWSGQASLRRSGSKNQTKTICLPSFEEET
jgi:hypothetical protein